MDENNTHPTSGGTQGAVPPPAEPGEAQHVVAPPVSSAEHRATHHLSRTGIAGLAVAAVLGAAGFTYAALPHDGSSTTSAASSSQAAPSTTQQYGQFTSPTQQGSTTESTAGSATTAQEKGLVYITTTLNYGEGEAAGTGMVLTSDGEILTNNHVVEGATKITVEVAATDKTYSAKVVGYDATHDVAVLQLDDASGLDTVTPDTTSTVAAGDAVTGVGNAGGRGGTASAAAGTVTATDQSITVQSESGTGSESLTGLIEVDADIISGDSGGPLYDSDGEVIGMDTAASTGSATVTGYAIPISTALSIAEQIESGTASGDVKIGYPAFLGVELSTTDSSTDGSTSQDPSGQGGFGQGGFGGSTQQQTPTESTTPLVAGTVSGSAAAKAGITAGSTITAFDGTSVSTSTELSDAVAQHEPGDSVSVSWTDSSGQSHTATVTLGEGPVG